jgi:prepilin-type N-terminal cleavage/methylation domain-containing protein
MKNEQGFSLVELLIVVAIIAIIAAIAVPSLMTARMSANEASAIQACRTLGSAEIAYAATANQQYATIAQMVSGAFVDSRFTNAGAIGGYLYTEGNVINAPGTQPPMQVGGAAPGLFSFTATHQAGASRYDYEIGVDQVVRWGAAVPPVGGMAKDDPLGK